MEIPQTNSNDEFDYLMRENFNNDDTFNISDHQNNVSTSPADNNSKMGIYFVSF